MLILSKNNWEYLYLSNETPNTKCSKIAEQHVEASDEVLSRKFIFKQN